ncbi:MAG: hypothetical protein L7S72_03075 [Flavobacteriales bacterium]|nr:hypothetical protein [Flavobacteriales bacterium]
MSNLFNTFKEAIENATMKWTEYKQRETDYKGKVNKGLDDLAALIVKLKACIDKLRDLEGDYASYISRITRIREGMQMMLNDQIGQIQRNSDKDCDAKIKELLEKFQGFVSQIGEWEGDANRFADLLEALDDEIKRLCDEADRIVAQNDDNRTNLDEELRKVEERLNPGGSSSKQDVGDDERKEGPGGNDDGLPDGWSAQVDPDSGNTYYAHTDGRVQWERPRSEDQRAPNTERDDDSTQRGIDAMNRGLRSGFEDRLDPTRALAPVRASAQKAKRKVRLQKFQVYADDLSGQNLERGQKRQSLLTWLVDNDTDPQGYPDAFTREERNKLVDSIMKGEKAEEGLGPQRRPSTFQGGARRKRRVTRKKRGGWQTPEKLESISRFSPIRRVERKKKKNNTKKLKKNKRKRRRNKKQTKRKGRKRN